VAATVSGRVGTVGRAPGGLLVGDEQQHLADVLAGLDDPVRLGDVVEAVLAGVWPAVEAGEVRPVVDRVLPLDDVAEAHRVVEASEHVGKVLLLVADE